VTAVGQILRIGQGVVDAQVIQVLEVLHVGTLDLGGALFPSVSVVAGLIEILQVGHVAGETPGRRTVHIGSGEGIKAQLVGAGMDTLGDLLQALKVLDVVHLVAGSLDQIGVDDDAVALVAVADRHQVAILVIQVVGIGVQLVGNGGILQVQSIILPVLHGVLVADNKQRGGIALVHLGQQGLVVSTGSGGDNLHVNAGLVLVHGGNFLQHLVRLGLEVQPIDRTFFGLGLASTATGQKADAHHDYQ